MTNEPRERAQAETPGNDHPRQDSARLPENTARFAERSINAAPRPGSIR
jgi:hypothetical protein